MQKQLTKWGLLFFVCRLSAFLDDQMPLYDPMSSMLMYGMLGDKNMSFADSVDRGIKVGVVRGISGLTGRALESALSGGITRISSAVRSAKKALMSSIYGNNKGFDVREIFAWRAIFESSVTTHILNVAKGARVVRAHVLAKEVETKPAETQALHGVNVLKSDMMYMISKLDEYEPYYTIKPNGGRGIVSRLLDVLALAATGYVIGDFFIRRTKKSEMVSEIEYWQKILEKQRIDESSPASARRASMVIAAKLDMCVDCLQQSFEQADGHVSWGAQWGIKKKHVQLGIKLALCTFAAVRLVQWLRSSEAVKAANLLSDINRDLVVHMIGALRSNLNYLISLCDGIKDESDLVRVKDDFEFISKNCNDALLQIAGLIDQEETLKMQRLGKSGQSPTQFNQGLSSFGAGLPKL